MSTADLIALLGILLAVGLLICLAFTGFNLLLAAPAAALLAAAFSGEPLLAHASFVRRRAGRFHGSDRDRDVALVRALARGRVKRLRVTKIGDGASGLVCGVSTATFRAPAPHAAASSALFAGSTSG